MVVRACLGGDANPSGGAAVVVTRTSGDTDRGGAAPGGLVVHSWCVILAGTGIA